MSILNDKQIRELCLKEDGMITPFVGSKVSSVDNNMKVVSYGCSHFGYDIRLSTTDLRIFSFKEGYTVVDPKRPGKYFEQQVTENFKSLLALGYKGILIPPHYYALGVSLEKFNIPPDIVGICVGKSTYARCGVIVNVTPLEPGWRGHLTIEISNANPLPVFIYLGEGICQILFFRGERPEQQYGGKYQGQEEEVVQAKV